MKHFFLMLVLSVLNFTAFAQSETYTAAMTEAVVQLDSAKGPLDFQASANTFARIAAAEPSQWLPAYYAAYSNLMYGFIVQEKDLNKAIASFDQAETQLGKARALAPQESEIVVLDAYLLIGRLMENPMALGARITPQVFANLEKAAILNPSNPRAPFLRGTYVMNMPAFYGGGAANAKPFFEKAAGLFEQEAARGLLPHWGQTENAQYLAQVSGSNTDEK